MTQNKTLSFNLKNKGLQESESIFMFYNSLRTVFETVFFLCYLLRFFNYLTLNHKQQCLFH